ncbi:hypothetical protein MTR67_000534 [Solanum verrucosum]|uniref:DNA repair protein XRCC2 homolog n=1 Tax=Solanum verrucosum TaxID=315347 RepID=A0AAF0T732_SOLVR|nr:hypothetical protein MTR67_000534 [Solanum verrucosum]
MLPCCRGNGIGQKLNKGDDSPSGSKDAHTEYDKELFVVSMRRFLYIRCYDSFEFLATLKTLHFQLQKEKEAHGSGVYLLMIDSIGAFYWMDRASPSIPPGSNNRKACSFCYLFISWKRTIAGQTLSTGQLSAESNLDSRTIRSSTNAQLYREYMPSVWQSFVSHRILVRPGNGIGHKLNKVDNSPSGSKDAHTEYDKELFAVSMRRFLYIRCYDSFEYLATLKTLHFQLQKEKEAHGSGVYLLMIDSIGAFYWMDRASPSIPPGSNNRRSLSLQSVSDIAVQEIQKILVVHPMLVLTTKAASLQDKFTSREVIRSTGQLSIESNLDSRTIRSSTNAQLYREYMPSVWQSFVSHRILVRPSDDSKYPKQPTYLSEWLLPSLKLSDKFTSNDVCAI